MSCPDIEELERYATGDTDPQADRTVGEHLQGCDSCRALLDTIRANLGDAEQVRHALREQHARSEVAMPGRIGSFRILRELGRGGMGVVYLAEQDKPRRLVALKVLRPGANSPDALRRLEHEAEALGRLRHPGIAAVYAAGTAEITSGGVSERVPYFAMEYISGERLDQYVRQRKLGNAERLELLARAAEAVHHAHVNGIVHRDLKPGNILVEPPQSDLGADAMGAPKILDFGVARVADADRSAESLRTASGQILGTVPYMSPEQLSGDPNAVDARSDVYALGTIGFELLSGELPHPVAGKSIAEMIRVITQEPPRRLREMSSRLRGDAEVILSKALENDPMRRYQSASELAADVRRYLAGEPIAARPPSAMYQLRRFAGRNRALSGALVALAITLVAGLVVSSWQAVRATRAERAARAEAQKATQVSDFLTGIFQGADPDESRGHEVTAREIVELGRLQANRELADQPEVRAAVLVTIGNVYCNLGQFAPAESLLNEALHTRQGLFPSDHPEIASNLNDLGHLERERENIESAQRLHREALAMYVRLPGDHQLETIRTKYMLGQTFLFTGERDSLALYAREAADGFRRLSGDMDDEYAMALGLMAEHSRSIGQTAQAESILTSCVAILRSTLGAEHLTTLAATNNLGVILLRGNKLEEARVYFEEALTAQRKLRGEDHYEVAQTLTNLATATQRLGQYEKAESLYIEALEVKRAYFGEEHPNTAITIDMLGSMLDSKGEHDRAAHYLRHALNIQRKLLGDDHLDVSVSLQHIATNSRNRGDFAAAEAAQRESMAIRRSYSPSWWIASMQVVLAEIVAEQGRTVEAESLVTSAIRTIREAEDAPASSLPNAVGRATAFYKKIGKPEKAAELEAGVPPATNGEP